MQRSRVISDDIMTSIPSGEGMSAAEWLAEQMPGGFFIYRADESMELLYVNQSNCDIFGCDTVEEFRELTGNNFKGMVHPDDYKSIQDSIDEQIAQPSNRKSIDYVVYRIIRKDGSIRWGDDYGHFATLPGYGEVYYVFIEDITEHKIAEEEKERVRNLDFSKIETGKMTLENEEYSLKSVVVDLFNLVQFRSEAKGLELNFLVDPELPSRLIGDEIRLKQIVTNILTNAVKYTEKGGVDFEIKLEEKLEDSVRFTVSVVDTGIGIREEDMQRLFEPFDRLDMKKKDHRRYRSWTCHYKAASFRHGQ